MFRFATGAILGFCCLFSTLSLRGQFVFESVHPLSRAESGQMDFDSLATNLWPVAIDGTSEHLTVRLAISKFEVRRGEPLDLFIYLLNDSHRGVQLPKIHPIAFLKLDVLTIFGEQVSLTPMGKWFAEEYGVSLDACGAKYLHPGRIRVIHADITELADIAEPGEYVVAPHCIFFSTLMTGLPQRADFPGMKFRVLDEPYKAGKKRPLSYLQASYDQHVLEKSMPPRPLPGPESELSPETRGVIKEAGRRAFERWEAEQSKSSNSPPTQTTPSISVLTPQQPEAGLVEPDSIQSAAQTAVVRVSSQRSTHAILALLSTFVLWLVLRRLR